MNTLLWELVFRGGPFRSNKHKGALPSMGIRIPRITISADYGDEHALGEIGPLAFGYGIHQAWIYAAMFGTSSFFRTPVIAGGNSSLVWLVSIIVFGICLIIAGFTDQKLLRFYVSKKTLIAATILTCITTLTILGSNSEGVFGVACTLIGGIGTGIGSALLLLFWGTAFARHESATIIVNTAIAIVVAVAIYSIVLHQIPHPFAGVVVALLPVFALPFIWKLTPLPYKKRHEVPVFNPLQVKKGWFAFRLMVPVFIFGFAIGSLRETSIQSVLPATQTTDQLLMLIASGIATVFILITVFAIGKTERWSLLFRALIPFIAIAVLFLPLSGTGNLEFADLILLVAYMCFEALMWIFFGELSQNFRLSPILVYGIGRGSLAIGAIIGSSMALSTTIPHMLPYFGESGVVMVILLAMVVAYALLPREKDVQELVVTSQFEGESTLVDTANKTEKLPVEPVEQPKQVETMKPGKFTLRCDAVSDRYLLSRRESEVLFFLAKGHNSAYIQEKLFISEGTAKTHIRHIYKKLDIHTQQDLMRIVDETPVE